jgi:hypothetical protein
MYMSVALSPSLSLSTVTAPALFAEVVGVHLADHHLPARELGGDLGAVLQLQLQVREEQIPPLLLLAAQLVSLQSCMTWDGMA